MGAFSRVCGRVRIQASLCVDGYETAWTMLHKLRRAMVAPKRGLLTGEVEVDECEVGGPEAGRRGGRSNIAAAVKVAVAVEIRGQGSGRIRMQIIHDASAETLEAFVMANVAPGAVVHTDGWMVGTHRSVNAEHLQVYLDEFTFRYNRRATPMASFQRLLGLESHHAPRTLRQITSDGPIAAKRT